MTLFTPATRRLAELMADAPRGPRRDGLFALWLTVRVVEDLPPAPAPLDRPARRRLTLLRKRLSSLTFPQPLRRGLLGAIHSLEEAAQPSRAGLLAQLAAVARECIGEAAGELLSKPTRGAVPR